jgi:dipeptidase D
MNIDKLCPEEVWYYFNIICQIPRPSKKEEKIIQYLLSFAKEHNLDYKLDEAGNVLIKKPAVPGYENMQTVVLQSHVDMVCEKNSGTEHNFDTDPIQPYIDDEWVKAKNTTLGADDGIGVAAQLAILASKSIIHGPIECLFTVDEETGLTGAYGLKNNFFDGKILLNLDSEDEGVLFIGCAGGVTTTGILEVGYEEAQDNFKQYKINITGLTGGHSGDDINKGRGNSIKILSRLLYNHKKQVDLKIVSIQGGNLHNAIPREAYASIAIANNEESRFLSIFQTESNDQKIELSFSEPNLNIVISDEQKPKKYLSDKAAKEIVSILYSMPNGVISMSKKISGLVETSTNLASIKQTSENVYEIVTSQRSSSDSMIHDIANKVESVFQLGGATFKRSTGYPGWEPNTDSQILNISKKIYFDLFKKEPIVTAIHAGLECGLFIEKYPGLDMISFGPDIKGAHSPDEKINIKSVDNFWQYLIEILNNIPLK